MNNASATANSLAIYRRLAVAGEPGSHIFAIAGGAFLVGGIQAFSGVDPANPIDAENGLSTPSGTNHDAPSVTTSVANSMLVTAHTYASSNTWTPQSGLSEGFDRPSGSSSSTGQSIAGGYQLQAAAGATGTKRFTAGGNADVGNAHILALRRFIPNAPPTVSLTSPTEGATFTAPASITLTATASDSDGTITKVELFHGGTNLIATLTAPPYTIQWTGVPQGAYALTAVATDNGSATTTSAPVNVTVGPAVATLYFIEVDHLNTPRLVANQSQQTVWRWDHVEPFGVNVPDENPSGLGAFDLPLRLPGQYFDKETNLHYNYYRDFDPSIGIYKQSDLIGLQGGLNTYAYVADPLRQIDPLGLMGFGGGGASGGASKSVPKPPSSGPAQMNIFGCIVGCLKSPLEGGEPQASLEPTIGGGIEICQRPTEPKSCPAPKPAGGCGIYDPNCDNTWQFPNLPIPSRAGFLIGVSIKRDGRVCFQYGLFGSLPLPSYDLGGINE